MAGEKMSSLPTHLREKIEKMEPITTAKTAFTWYHSAESLWKILSECDYEEEKAIEEMASAYAHEIYDYKIHADVIYKQAAHLGLALGRVKAEKQLEESDYGEQAVILCKQKNQLEAKLQRCLEALQHYESAHYHAACGHACVNDKTATETLASLEADKGNK